ncbi:sulfatase-like hydrolase/transferase [Gammaproteobacteria bacterium]|nr:sulfatase-like hydrolase/transferase [Gammaproteobacteria bacterium]
MKNVILIMTDDQGYGDLSCMGATDFRTPHLDRLANDGARFSCWYSNSPVCSPSRAALLTGRYPGNAGVRSILAGHRTATGMPAHVPSLPRLLQRSKYRTIMSGKWHLGLADGCRPHDHGFDDWFGFLAGCVDFYSHIFYWGMNRPGPALNPTHDLWDNNQEVWRNGEYLTEVITQRAVAAIRRACADDAPFFLYVPYNAPHYPMHAPKEYMDRFDHLPWDRQVMAAMISAVDDGIGAIQAELERQGLSDSTCTFFTSDNGPSRESRNWLDGNQDPYYGGQSGALKGHKFSLFEGGVRVPGIVHFPGVVPGGQEIETPFCSVDVLPTLCDWLDIDVGGMELDGVSQAAYLSGSEPLIDRDLFWEMGNQTSIRRGPWKLVLNGELVEGVADVDTVFLANLEIDPGESINRIGDYPDMVNELRDAAEAWRRDIEERWSKEFSVERQGTTGRTN